MYLSILLLACTAGTGTPPDGAAGDGGAPDGGATLVEPVAAPLASMPSILAVTWGQPAAATGHVELRLEGEDTWRSTPAVAREAGPAEALLLGLPFDAAVEWRLVLEPDPGLDAATQTTATGPVPEGLPAATVHTLDEAQVDPAHPWTLLSVHVLGSGSWTLIVDRQGRAVWAQQSPRTRITLHPRLSHDGTQLLIDHNSYWALYDDGEESQVLRVHVDGRAVETIDTPGLHHPYTDLPGGGLAYGRFADYVDEELVVLDPDGGQRVLFSCGDWMQQHRVAGYCGSNTIWYDPQADRFLYSFYSVETMVELDAQTGEVRRWYGHAPGGWGFEPADAAFWWQHGGHLTEDGTLLLSAKRGEDEDETVWREYALDEEAQVLIEVASGGLDQGVYGDVMGEAHRLDNGNTLHNTGSAPRLREFTPDGAIAWDLSWQAELIGRSTPIRDLYSLAR